MSPNPPGRAAGHRGTELGNKQSESTDLSAKGNNAFTMLLARPRQPSPPPMASRQCVSVACTPGFTSPKSPRFGRLRRPVESLDVLLAHPCPTTGRRQNSGLAATPSTFFHPDTAAASTTATSTATSARFPYLVNWKDLSERKVRRRRTTSFPSISSACCPSCPQQCLCRHDCPGSQFPGSLLAGRYLRADHTARPWTMRPG